ncbi:Zn-ribbon domain-containing OB-fold protein [Chloroflexota bacterium]
MGIEKFGQVSFTSESKAADFVKYLEMGRVMATRCKQCSASFFPPRVDCPDCINSDVEWVEITGKGKLLTYTLLQYTPAGFENDAPYTLALADFNGIHLFGRMSGSIKAEDIQVGMELTVTPVNLAENKIAYEFQPD